MRKLWLVGSGPSLRNTPLDILYKNDQDVMVMNKFGRVSEALGFEIIPKYYFKIDINTVDNSYREEIRWAVDRGVHCFLWDQIRDGYPPGHSNYDKLPGPFTNIQNVTWIPLCKHHPYQWNNFKAAQSWHLPELCTAFGGMSPMIQLGTVLEYDAVILLGCDLGYTPFQHLNHAIPDYTTDTRDKQVQDTGNMMALHHMAKRCSPIPVYNATIGGELEVYPRITLEEGLDL